MTTDELIESILKREGGFVDHPADKGGPTNHGITQKTLSQYRGRPASRNDVQGLTRGEAAEIYHRLYVLAPGFWRISNEHLRAMLVDIGVNHGPKRAVLWLQAAVGVEVDGVLGELTASAVNVLPWRGTYAKICASRCESYGEIINSDYKRIRAAGKCPPMQAAFAEGWAKRTAEFIRVLGDQS